MALEGADLIAPVTLDGGEITVDSGEEEPASAEEVMFEVKLAKAASAMDGIVMALYAYYVLRADGALFEILLSHLTLI